MAGHREDLREDGFAEIPTSLAVIAYTAISRVLSRSNVPKQGRKNTARIALFEAIRIGLFEA
jgi:hypothetical protein